MYVTDLRKDFFGLLGGGGRRVLVLANMDVDSVCAVKILQTLLKYDHCMFTVVPVQGKSDLFNAFKAHCATASGNEEEEEDGGGGDRKYVVMINCGGTMDVVDFLDPPDNVVIFIADSHRPTDVCNIYSDGQIRLLMKPEQDEDVPAYDDIFKDSDDEEEDDDDEDEEAGDDAGDSEADENVDENGGVLSKKKKRPRFEANEAEVLKRRERRLWEEKRAGLLFEYQKYSYYGPPTASLMFELAWKMSQDTNDLLWWAIVGHTEQLLTVKTQAESYIKANTHLRDHVSRLNINLLAAAAADGEGGDGGGDGAAPQGGTQGTSVDCMKLSFEKELNLNLYRHWTVYDSLCHSMYTASKFKIWTLKGRQRLSEFLAELGLPLVQCKQKFSTMDLDLRSQILQLFEEKADKYGLEDITYGSYVANYGYRNKFCAGDAVYASLATMEQHTESCPDVGGEGGGGAGKRGAASPEKSFYTAVDGLSRSNIAILEKGIEKGRDLLGLVMKQVQNFLDLRLIVSAGPFLYTVIRDGSPDSRQFSRPNTLGLLAHFTLRAHVSVTSSGGGGGSSSKKVQSLPLVISAPLDEGKGTCLVLGIPPLGDRSRKNLLGKAFEQAARKTNCRYLLDYFDASVIQLKTEDRSKFFDGLISVFT